MGAAGRCRVKILCLSAAQPQQHRAGPEITAFLKPKRGCVPGSCAHVLPLATQPESISWTGRWPCTDASPNFTVPKPLLSRKCHLHALLSWELYLTFPWQPSLSKPIPLCLSPHLCRFPRYLKPQACSSHQRPSPLLLRGNQCHHHPSLTVPSYLCRARSTEKGKSLGDRQNPATTALSPLSQKALSLNIVQYLRCDLAAADTGEEVESANGKSILT